MSQLTLLASTAVMGVLLIGTVLAVSRQDWKRVLPDGGQPANSGVSLDTGNPAVWSVAFLLLVAATLGGTLLLVTDTIPVAVAAGIIALPIPMYIVWGAYDAARQRGLHQPAALAAAAWMAGMLFTVGVVLRLLEIV